MNGHYTSPYVDAVPTRRRVACSRRRVSGVHFVTNGLPYGPKIPDHPFRGHFVSGSGGLGTRLALTIDNRGIPLLRSHSPEMASILKPKQLTHIDTQARGRIPIPVA